MKNYIQYLTIGALLMGSLTSCNDFLDREPLDKVTPEKFFSAEADLEAYAINNYKFVTVDDKYGINLFGKDNDTDNQASGTSNSFWIPGEKKVAADRGEWKWEDIRSCNYFFDQVLPRYEEGAITGNQDNVKHYIGEMYVNRAYSYFQLLTKFGDLPIVTTALPDIQGELVEASKRQPRHKVARFIIEDLKKAEDMLLNNPPGGKNRISKNVAYLLHARVALYEATWEKYHRGTAFVPGGSGWPGKDAQGYDADVEINYFLDEAIAASKFVADQMVGNLAENTDTPEGMNASLVSINPYYTMFCDENMEGYKEILMWKKFDESLGVTSNLQMELCRNGGGSGWTRGMVNSFLMRNGLPVYASGSGYNPDWEKEGVVATVQNRDSRLGIFTKKPGDVNYYGDDGTPSICQISLIFGDAGSLATTGYIVKKGKHYSTHMANDHSAGTSGGIVFRGAEAMLIYMEASYEKNGTVDGTADGYWRALRTRAKVDPDYNKTIAATNMLEEAKGDFAAYSHGTMIDPTLYNIRRERRCELIGEGFRYDDLIRWRALDQLNGFQLEGCKIWGPMKSLYGDRLVTDQTDPSKNNVSSPSLSEYIRPFQRTTDNNNYYNGLFFCNAHYLSPIAVKHFLLTTSDGKTISTSPIYQNPGWSTTVGEGANLDK